LKTKFENKMSNVNKNPMNYQPQLVFFFASDKMRQLTKSRGFKKSKPFSRALRSAEVTLKVDLFYPLKVPSTHLKVICESNLRSM